ncbi:MAG: hypothetical protein A3G20_07045 [Acidobacteria bacterium RIFCSPLOWO2_12_FULL_59_11]|nr:MAG: hypothetical protein A3G20_07045 [Acidobacteria bacterium RIFCSPLOWO2_12_FULL_59_11]OFW21197.1 MAG: hypothetical protein A3H27_09010 [Acidobacteria bacterium RIFCSPLOWO2_02_FULL_59_13]
MRRAVIMCCLLSVSNVMASDRLSTLLASDPASEAERAFASGDRRHIVVPVCGKDTGEVIPGWPLEHSPEVQHAMEIAKRPISCADLGDDPKKANFVRAANYAERYNRKMLELEGKGKK